MASGSGFGVSDNVNKLKEKSSSSDEQEQFLLKRHRPADEQQQLPIAKRRSNDDVQELKKNNPRRPTTDGEQQLLLEFFGGCTHPNSMQLTELAEKLKWELKRVKNWFQNKRSASKALENLRKSKSLQIEMEKLRMENKSLKEKLNKHNSSSSPSVIPGSEKSVGVEQNCSPSAISGPEKSFGKEQNVLSRPISHTPFYPERRTNMSTYATKKLVARPIIGISESAGITEKIRTQPISSKPFDSDWRTNKFIGNISSKPFDFYQRTNMLTGQICGKPFDSDRRTNMFSRQTDTAEKLVAEPIDVFPESDEISKKAISSPFSSLPFNQPTSSISSDFDGRTNMFSGRADVTGKLAAGTGIVFSESADTTINVISQPMSVLPSDSDPRTNVRSDTAGKAFSQPDMLFDSQDKASKFAGSLDTAEKLVAGPMTALAGSVDTAGKLLSPPISDMPSDSGWRSNQFAGPNETTVKLVSEPMTTLSPLDSVEMVGTSVESANKSGKLLAGAISCKLPTSVQSGDIPARPLTSGTITDRVSDSARLVDSAVPSTDTSAWWDLAFSAIEELEKMVKVDEPLWLPNVEGGLEKLNYEHYRNCYARCFPTKKDEFVWEATRVTVQINIPSLAIVEALMDGDKWAEMFPGIICSTNTTKVISSGRGGTQHCALNLMQAEFQVVSPLVPLRCVNFLRFCKNINATTWAVVDVSVDTDVAAAEVANSCRRLPSGCLIEKLSNGSSKVTWVEHTQYNKIYVHSLYRKLLRRGLGFGAPRWIAALLRHIQRPETISGSSDSLTENRQRRILKMASQMTGNFCAAVCGSSARNWRLLSIEKDLRLLIRNSKPQEEKGIMICAATSIPLSTDHHSLFKCLLKKRSRWDFVTCGMAMKEKARIPKGQDDTNSVTLFAAENGNGGILQETYTDHALAMVVCAPAEVAMIDQLMNGTEPAKVALLPYGFAVMPDSMGGSLLTVGFTSMVMEQSLNKMTKDEMNNLLSQIIQNIQGMLGSCK